MSEEIKIEIGKRIREERERQGLSLSKTSNVWASVLETLLTLGSVFSSL